MRKTQIQPLQEQIFFNCGDSRFLGCDDEQVTNSGQSGGSKDAMDMVLAFRLGAKAPTC